MAEENKPGRPLPDGLDNQGQGRPLAQGGPDDGETPIYLSGNSTLQTGAEHQHDQSIDPREDRSVDVNRDDQHEIRAGRLTGRDPYDQDQNSNA